MQKIHLIAVAIILFTIDSPQSFSQTSDASAGQQLFKSNCSACHSIGSGKVVGPDLIGINQKRDEKWLMKWIKSSQSLIKSGDKDAIAINSEYNKIAMTDFAFLKDEEIKSILSYVETQGNVASASVVTPPVQDTAKDSTYHLTAFDYFFFSIAAILLLVVYTISRRITRMADQLGDMYENERAFFKK